MATSMAEGAKVCAGTVYAVFVGVELLAMIAAKSCEMYSFRPGEVCFCVVYVWWRGA